MLSRSATSLLLTLTALALPAIVGAQARDHVRVGVSGGATLLNGRSRNLYGAGPSATLNVLIPVDERGFSVRVDASLLQAPGRNHRVLLDPNADSVTVGGLSAQAVTASAVLGPPSDSIPIRPFLSVGGAVYHMRMNNTQAGADAAESTTGVALVYGAGASFPLGRWRGLVEARAYTFYSGLSALRLYPVTVGVLF
jgi:hypothetical protein